MITYIVGHRGVGKSSFLKRLQSYFAKHGTEAICLDLDDEIEKSHEKSISEIFATEGESAFRKLEREMVESVASQWGAIKKPVFVAVGGGYLGPFPDPSQVLWLRRVTDRDGRVFLDRPRLDVSTSPYQEYMDRFAHREYSYLSVADEHLTLPEGEIQETDYESIFLGFPADPIGGYLTLFEKDIRKFSGAENFVSRRLKWGVERFELRDDLLEDILIRYMLGLLPKDRLLLSFRKPGTESLLYHLPLEEFFFDWPAEKGPCPHHLKPDIFSLHEKKGSLQDSLLRFEDQAPERSHLKLAVEVDTWQELLEGHNWWREDPSNRSFLPRSQDGKWQWYRILFGRQMKVAFFKEGAGSAYDQPYFAQWVQAPFRVGSFAAIIGNPIHHSLTPTEQRAFFQSFQMPVLAIPMEDRGDFTFHLEVLRHMGLRAAAITSPMKERALEVCSEVQAQASRVKAVNTLMLRRGTTDWVGANTDLDGLRAYIDLDASLASEKDIVIWGGGGTRQVMKEVFPNATPYSARSGKPVNGYSEVQNPKVIIWAVGRTRQPDCQWPPEDWPLERVIDLNYTMDSPGREFAVMKGLEYQSGITMFQAQARAQQRFWIEQGL